MYGPWIINTYNIGNVNASKNAGGILGFVGWSEAHLENCYNAGNVSGSIIGGILGGSNISGELFVTKNVRFLNTTAVKGIGQNLDESAEDIKSITDQELKSKNVLELFNTYVQENQTIEGIELKRWTKPENGYLNFN